jgi:hypothetical protein
MQEAEATMSTADELVELDALPKSGTLSQEEFDTEKAKLFGASQRAQ